MKNNICLFLFMLLAGPLTASGIYNVKDFGADGKTRPICYPGDTGRH